MKRILLKIFSNNGIARGLIYFSISFLTPIAESLLVWANDPPSNLYAVAAVPIIALIAGLVALRAYMDGHLARSKHTVADPDKSGPIAPT